MEEPKLEFKCNYCGARCQGHAREFKELHTMPPQWEAKCAYCFNAIRVAPTPLIARVAATYYGR